MVPMLTRSHFGQAEDIVLRNARILDPEAGLDVRGDVLVERGLIAAVGGDIPAQEGRRELDLQGAVLTPGWVDIHMHAFGAIGFADADAVGVHAGVTTLCDAGGAGAYTFEDFEAQLAGTLRTDLYSWLYIGPSGIAVSLVAEEQAKDIRSIVPEIPVTTLLELLEQHRPTIAGMKVPAFGPTGEAAPMRMAKGLAGTLGIPLYIHVGDIQESQPLPLDMDEIIDMLDPADTVTHCYSPNPNSLFQDDDRLFPSVKAAVERGVGFDLGMGAFNFDFNIARRAMDVGFLPTTLSTDLQQANVTGPTYSLAHVMSMFLALGMTLEEIVPRVTSAAASRLGAADRHGRIEVGRAADLTVFEVVDRDMVFQDTVGGRLPGTREVQVRWTLKDGQVIHPNLTLAADESNWSLASAIDEDELPTGSAAPTAEVQSLYIATADALSRMDGWDATTIHHLVRATQLRGALTLGESGRALLSAFMHPVFPQSPGFFLSTLERDFAIERLRAAARA
jgi:dihydroorotase